MAESRNVRDVPAEEFIKAYAAHLRSNDKVKKLGIKKRGERSTDEAAAAAAVVDRRRKSRKRALLGLGIPLRLSFSSRRRRHDNKVL